MYIKYIYYKIYIFCMKYTHIYVCAHKYVCMCM